jgi:hypothetical protein
MNQVQFGMKTCLFSNHTIYLNNNTKWRQERGRTFLHRALQVPIQGLERVFGGMIMNHGGNAIE